MQFTTEDLTRNTAAMTAAMGVFNHGDLLEKWGQGCVELYEAIGYWAGLVSREEELLWQAANGDEEGGFWGVFAYEVTESVACDIRELILQGEQVSNWQVKRLTRVAIREFCSEFPHVWKAYAELSPSLVD